MTDPRCWALALALLSLLASCKPQPEQKVETVPEVVKPVTQYYEKNLDSLSDFQTFSASFSCEIQGISANGLLRIDRDSIIWLTLNKIVELGRLKATPDSLLAYLKITNQYVRLSFPEMKSQMGVDMDFATLQSVLLGQGSMKSQLLVEYDDFDSISGQEIPRSLDITFNDKRFYQTARVKYGKINVDIPQSYPFYIPKNAKPFNGIEDLPF